MKFKTGREMNDQSKRNGYKNVPSIQITLTTFTDDENGVPSLATTGTVKIDGDGDDESSRGVILDCHSVFRSEHVRNLFLLSLGQFLLWMAFDTLSSLQSILDTEDHMGEVSHAVVYGALAISSFFLPTLSIKRFGCKKTLVYATIGFCPYILANFYPSWPTLIPSAVLCGLCSGILSPSRSLYINKISYRYASLQKYSLGVTNAWFFGVYTVVKQNTEIWGSLLSYHVLKGSDTHEQLPSEDAPEIVCGSEFCGDELNYFLNLDFPPEGSRLVLVAVFTGLCLTAAFFLAFFLQPLVSEEQDRESQKEKLSSVDLLAACHHLTDVEQILLLPLSLYTGLVEGFYIVDFKKVYIACAWGVPYIAFVSICHGLISALIAFASGPCLQILGRATLFILAALAHLTMFLALLLWKPDSEHTAGFFLIASALGIGNGVWMSQIVALYGVVFKEKKEVGFSCYYFLNSLGFLLAYSYSSYLCTNVKIFIPLTFLILGLIAYLALEVRILKKVLFQYNSKRRN